MAQLRLDYDNFLAKDVEIIVIGPENAAAFQRYWDDHGLPFIGLPDPKHSVLKLYGQEVKLFKLGRMPAQVLVDIDGLATYAHYGNDMSDIPSSEEILAALEKVQNTA
jgi:peroxiredoxin Q/BCP